MNTKNTAASKTPRRRYELTDDQCERLESHLPEQPRGGRWADHRTVLYRMFQVLHSISPQRDMPERYGRWDTVYGRLRRYTDEGRIDRTLTRFIYPSTRTAESTGASSMSMGPPSAPRCRKPEARTPQTPAERTGRIRLERTLGSLCHEASSCIGRSTHPAWGGAQSRPTP